MSYLFTLYRLAKSVSLKPIYCGESVKKQPTVENTKWYNFYERKIIVIL